MERKILQVAEFVHRRAKIVVKLEVLAQLGEATQNQFHHQLRRHQLAEREFPLDDEPASHAQQRRACQRMYAERAEDLADQNVEVLGAVVQIIPNQAVGPRRGVFHRRRSLEGCVESRRLLEPGNQRVLGLALVDAGPHRAHSHRKHDDNDRAEQQDVERQQPRVIQAEQNHPDQSRSASASPRSGRPPSASRRSSAASRRRRSGSPARGRGATRKPAPAPAAAGSPCPTRLARKCGAEWFPPPRSAVLEGCR